ncbi:ESPR-type extended signal peptide-containing protein, partial [Haemophilus parahaemolyticus]
MNKVFKVIWNHATQSWVAVSELTSAKGKTKSKKLTALSVAVGSALVGTPALAAVYVNNQEVAAAGSSSRLVISTGASQTIADKIDSTTTPKYDYFIRIGDAGNPVTRDGDILIGFGHKNLSSGEAGDTIIGHRANIGGGNLDSFSTGVGYRVQSAGPSVSIGVGARSDIKSNSGWNSTRNGGVAIGAYALQGGNADGGVAVGALSGGDYNYITSIGTLSGVGGYQVDQVRDKGYRVNGGNEGATSIGYSAGARGRNSVAVGREATTANGQGRDAVSVGYSTHSIGESSVALGPYAVAGGFSASEITALQAEKTRLEGVIADINSDWGSARDQLDREAGTVSTVEVKFRMGQLLSAREKAQQELNRINADLTRTSATPTQSTTTAMAIGYKALANNLNATAIGRQSQASAISAVALGTSANVSGANASSALAIGHDARVIGDTAVNATAIGRQSRIHHNATGAIAFGSNSNIYGDSSNSIAIGTNANISNQYRKISNVYAVVENATVLGSFSTASANKGTAVGSNNTVIGASSGALGSDNTVGAYSSGIDTSTYNGTRSFVVGSNNTVTLANDTMVFGNNVAVTEANRSGSVILGNDSSVPENVTAINSAKVGNVTYAGFAGNLGGKTTDGTSAVAADQGRFVSIGNSTSPRQLKHVAAGRIANDSTDAINGSQLYSLTGVVSNMGVSVANVIGGNAVLNPNGTVSGFSQPLNTTALGNDETYTAPTAPAANVSTAITNLNNYVNAGWKIAEGNDTAAKARISPNEQVNFKADGLATVSVAENTTNKGADVTYSVQKGTFDTTTNGTVKASSTEGVVTNTDVATAVNNSGWNTTTTGGTNVTVNPGDQVNYVNGNGTTANVTTKTVDGKDVVSVSYDVKQTTGTVNPNGTVKVAEGNSFLNASTVANLVNNAAFNVTTAKVDAFVTNQEGKANATVKAGGNITYTAGKNIAIKQAGTNFTFSTTKDVTFENATVNQTLTVGNGTNATNFTSTSEGLKVATSTGDKQAIVNVKSTLPGTADNNEVVTTERTLPTLTDAQKATAATVDDVLNAGWNLRGQKTAGAEVEAVDFVKPYDTVVFKSGNNATTDVVTTTDANNKVSTVTITAKAEPVKTSGLTTTVNNNGTVSVATGEDGTNLVNATTVANAINASGWNTNVTNATTGATETKVVTPGTQVDYVNGNGTTANVTLKDGKVAVSYNVNSTTGTVNPNGTVKVAEGNSFLNASTVANLVNNAAFNVTTAKVDAFVTNQEGKANATVKAGGNITYTAGKNIAISQNGSNFTFSTTKDVVFNNAQVNSTLTIGNGTATSPKVNIQSTTKGLDMGNAVLTNVSSGITPYAAGTTPVTTAKSGLADLANSTQTNVVTVADAAKLGWVVSTDKTTTDATTGTADGNVYAANVTTANEVKFVGKGYATVSGATDSNGVRTITVSVGNVGAGKINADGSVTETKAGLLTAEEGTKLINGAGWLTNVTNATTGATETKVVTPGTQVDYVNGNGTTANVTLKDGKVAVSYNVNQTTGSVNTNGTAKVADGNSFLNASTVANLVNNASFSVTTAKVDAFAENQEGKANTAVKAGGNITYTAGKNIAISQNGSNFTFSTTKDIEVDSVTANNRVQIGSGNTAVNLTTDLGALKVADKDGNATQITNVDAGAETMAFNKDGDQLVKVGDKYYVVDPETGTSDFTTEGTPATEEELDELVKAKPELKAYVAYAKAASGLADLDNSVQTNALTVADAQRLGWVVSASGNDYADNVTNANEVRFNGVNGISVTGNTTDGVRNINISLNTTTLTSNANGTTTVTNGNNYVNGTTVADAINKAGWNTKLSDGTTLNVNPGDQVNYVSGKGTTANVTKAKDANGNDVVSVSYNVNQTTGSLNPNGTAKVADGDSFLNASTVANLVNNAAFNVTTAKVDAFAENQEGKANAAVKAGGNITYTAGKNIAISQNGSNFTFSTTKDIEVDSVTANNRVQIGSGDTAVNLTSDSGALQVADKDGNATQITNVEAGTNVMAFNKEGDQLVQVGDKFYVVNPETNEVDFDQESTPATEEELDKLAKAKPELKAYVAYAKAASGLADLDNSEQTNALTVADAQRLGWVVSASGNDYADSVT